MSYTLSNLRKHLAKSLDSYVSGTATGGSTTTVIDTELLDSGQFSDDHFNGAEIYILDTTDDAAPKGEARYVTDFVQSTGVITVGKAFSASVDSGDSYEIYLRTTVDELNEALLFGVRDWRWVASVQLSDSNSEYTLSIPHLHRAEQVKGIWIRADNDPEIEFRPVSNYRIWDNAGTLVLSFGNNVPLDSDMVVRVEYVAEYSQLQSSGSFVDTATVGGDLSLHILKARKYFYERRMQGSSGVDRDWYAQMVRYTNDELAARNGKSRRRPAKAKMQDWERVSYRQYHKYPWR